MKACKMCKRMIAEKEMVGEYCRECLSERGEREQENQDTLNERSSYLHDYENNAKPTTQEDVDAFREYLWSDVRATRERLESEKDDAIETTKDAYFHANLMYLKKYITEADEEVEDFLRGLFNKYNHYMSVGAYKVIIKDAYSNDKYRRRYGSIIESNSLKGTTVYLVSMVEQL